MNRYCPVCRQNPGPPSAFATICSHLDSAGIDTCPMSGQSYTLTGIDRTGEVAMAAQVRAADTRAAIRLDRLERLLAS